MALLFGSSTVSFNEKHIISSMATLGKSLSKLLSPRQYSSLSISPNKKVLTQSPNYSDITRNISNFQKIKSSPEITQRNGNEKRHPTQQPNCAKRLAYNQLQVPKSEIPLINSPLTKELANKGVECIASQNILGRGRFGIVIKGLYKEIFEKAAIINVVDDKSIVSCLGCSKNCIVTIIIDNPIAVKVVAKDQEQSEKAHKEENAVPLDHPNIIRVLKTVSYGGNYDIILMEYCSGDNLLQKINDPTFTLDIKRSIRYALELGYALQHCHKNRIIHLDVKPENIIIDQEDHCKLCDFGSSRIMDCKNGVRTPWPGTPVFAAPEVLKGFCVTCRADVYSFAITMWQMLSRVPPYFGEDIHSVIYKVVAQHHRPRKINPKNSEQMKYIQLYEECWTGEFEGRPTMDEAIRCLLNI